MGLRRFLSDRLLGGPAIFCVTVEDGFYFPVPEAAVSDDTHVTVAKGLTWRGAFNRAHDLQRRANRRGSGDARQLGGVQQ